MSTTHTPGPWTVQTLGEKINGYPDWNSYCIRHLNQNVHIATVGHVDRYYETQNEANARLIAASPDLLDELETRAGNLETIAAYLQRWQDNGAIKPDKADTPALDVMITGLLICSAETRAAIAKAKQPNKTGQILTVRLSETSRYIDRATGEAFEEPPDTQP